MKTTIIDILEAALVGNQLAINKSGDEMIGVGRVKSVQFGGYGNQFSVQTDKGTATLWAYDRIEISEHVTITAADVGKMPAGILEGE